MKDADADVLIVGAGIAGAAAAYYAARAGRSVIVVDEGVRAASSLPVALINPLRGHAGRLVARGVDGMHATFALIDALVDRGHRIAFGRGLHRPLLDRHATTSNAAYWRARLTEPTSGPPLAFDWHVEAPESLGLVEPAPSLFLHDAGWVEPASLLAALAAATPAMRVAARVATVTADAATLTDGTRIVARAVLWCGGAHGAALLDDRADDAGSDLDGLFKPGSLVAAATEIAREPLAFGLYAVPIAGGTIVGPTREGSANVFVDAPVATAAVRHLEDRVAALFGATIRLEPVWRGTRLAKLSTSATSALRGVTTLTALDSRGFLMAPLLAEDWSRSL